MEIVNEFVVPVTRDRAWDVLTNLGTVAECLPGAKLTRKEGDDYLGNVRVKVGPITATYSGKARFVSLEKSVYRAELHAEGRETKGQGNASATVVAQLVDDGGETRVTVTVDLSIAGKVAQFGRGVLGEVSEKLMAQFAKNLEKSVMQPEISDETIEIIEEIHNGDETIQMVEVIETPGGEELGPKDPQEEVEGPSAGSSREDDQDDSSINGLRLVAKPLAKRVAPVFAAAVVVAIVLRRRGSKRRTLKR